MPSFICKYEDRYFEYSTISDCPETYLMTLEEFGVYYRDEYGRADFENELPIRMSRVQEYGSSCYGGISVEDLVSNNRYGEDEANLGFKEFMDKLVEGSG